MSLQLRRLVTELGEFIVLTHPILLDLSTGLVGVTNVLCEVIDRQPNYADGKLEYTVIDCRFVQETTPYEIAPDGTPDWPSGGAASPYIFICDDTGKMSDGAGGRTLF